MTQTYNILRPFNYHGKQVSEGQLELEPEEAAMLLEAGVIEAAEPESAE